MGSTSSEGSSESVSPPQPHVLLFPFMAKGHTIPLLHFARLLLRRGIAVTVVTTPSNLPFVSHSLEGTAASIFPLPFPADLPGIPAGTESTDKLPSISLFFRFATSTSRMQPYFDRLLRSLPRVTFLVSDAFLWWTQHSASRLGVPRLAFFGFSCYSYALRKEVYLSGLFNGPQFDDEFFSLTRFPWIRLSKLDFEPEVRRPDPNSLAFEFHRNTFSATSKSHGILVNSFYELEPDFADYAITECTPRSWCVGPFCLENNNNNPHAEPKSKPIWAQWLDQKLEERRDVLYVAFGTQTEISREQLKEIAFGLEESKVNFFWVMRKGEWEAPEGFEERVKKRGIVVREWVDQWGILMHESVKGFVSHCGWNSVLESVCAGVPILAWPMMGEQHLNARMVEEEMKVGIRVETREGSVRGFVGREGLERRVRELMEGDKGREARKKVKELAGMAKKALEEGGSSCCALDLLIHETFMCMYE